MSRVTADGELEGASVLCATRCRGRCRGRCVVAAIMTISWLSTWR